MLLGVSVKKKKKESIDTGSRFKKQMNEMISGWIGVKDFNCPTDEVILFPTQVATKLALISS